MLNKVFCFLTFSFLFSLNVLASRSSDNSAVMAVLNDDWVALDSFLRDKPELLEVEAEPDRFPKKVEHSWIPLTPLMAAVTMSNQRMVGKLLQRGADLSHATVYTPLSIAARQGDLSMARFLLEQQADVNQTPGSELAGETALYYAVFEENYDVAALLLKWHANPNLSTLSRVTPLMSAATSSDLRLCELIAKAGADLNAVDEDGHSALHYAVQNYRVQTVSYLIQRGAAINSIEGKHCRDGSLLHHLIEALAVPRSGMIWRYFSEARPAFAVAELLIEHGIDLQLKDRFGKTALEKANDQRQLYRTPNWMISNPVQNPVWTLHDMILQALSKSS